MGNLSDALSNELARDLYAASPSFSERQECAARQLTSSLFKKYVEESSTAANAAALDLFLSMNSRCATWLVPDTSTWKRAYLYDRFRFWFRHYTAKLYDAACEPYDIWLKGKFGKGANVSASGVTHYQKLYAGKITTANASLSYYHKLFSSMNADERQASGLRSSAFGEIAIVAGSKLSFVAKNNTISRCICTEPTLEMFFQQGLDSFIRALLSRDFGINLDHQQARNARLALDGSVDGSFATIDLSSASDTISTAMLRDVCDGRFLAIMDSFRSKRVHLPNGELLDLHLFSSMGNGYTFSLQTLIFCVVVKVVYEMHSLPFIASSTPLSNLDIPDTYAVNGDDIVVVNHVFQDVCMLLSMLGFIPNPDKSFSTGYFRESCGVDAFRGANVRGIYIKCLETPHDRYSAFNRLAEWSANQAIPLTRTLLCLLDNIASPAFVPPSASLRDGIKVPRVAFPKGTIPKAYDTYTSKPAGFRLSNFGSHNDFQLVSLCGRLASAVSGSKFGRKPPLILHNPWGIALCVLNNTLRSDSPVPVKNGTVKLVKRAVKITDWDLALSAGSLHNGLFSQKSIETWVSLVTTVIDLWALGRATGTRQQG